jgi:CO/xanthine dehydrogenase Mo-binding subunit
MFLEIMMGNNGSNITRIDALEKVKGEARYPGDFYLPDMLTMKVLFSKKVHAIIEEIDISEAEKVPGVILILTARDVPVNEYGLIQPDQPVLCGPGSNKPYADRVRFIGDQIALIIAETPSAAETARSLIKVKYHDLPIISNIEQAISADSVLLHPDKDSNIFVHNKIRKGDVKKAFAKAEVIVEGVYRTPVQEHAYLQPESGVAYIDDEDRITVGYP